MVERDEALMAPNLLVLSPTLAAGGGARGAEGQRGRGARGCCCCCCAGCRGKGVADEPLSRVVWAGDCLSVRACQRLLCIGRVLVVSLVVVLQSDVRPKVAGGGDGCVVRGPVPRCLRGCSFLSRVPLYPQRCRK